MELIDFDGRFAGFLRAWLEEHQDEAHDLAEVEDMMPALYEDFLDTPAPWLSGEAPRGYFEGESSPARLIRQMLDYLRHGVTVPELLLARLHALGAAAEAPLVDLLREGDAPEEARMLAVRLLLELGSLLPLPLYVSWQVDRAERDALADFALESLEEMGEEAVPAMLEALEAANEPGREALLGILSHYPRYPQVYSALVRLFDACPGRQAVLAAYLGRLGDERALPLLLERAREEGLRYLDYIELRSAIEALGGDAPERDFGEDPEYEALRGLTEP